MKSLLESIRRLLVVSIYVGGISFAGFLVSIMSARWANSTEAVTKLSLIIVCTLVAMPVAHKLLNWILLKDEKKPTSVNL